MVRYTTANQAMARYRQLVDERCRIRRRNRLTAARRLGCDAMIRHFTGPTLWEAKPYVFLTCGNGTNLDSPYITAQLKRISRMGDDGHVWVALDRADGMPLGYALGYVIKLNGVPAMRVETLCTDNYETGRRCAHIGIHLMHRVAKDAKRLRLSVVTLEATPPAERFYLRLGFRRTSYPCASQAARARASQTRKNRATQEYLDVHFAAPGDRSLSNQDIINRLITGNLIRLSKCIRKNA